MAFHAELDPLASKNTTSGMKFQLLIQFGRTEETICLLHQIDINFFPSFFPMFNILMNQFSQKLKRFVLTDDKGYHSINNPKRCNEALLNRLQKPRRNCKNFIFMAVYRTTTTLEDYSRLFTGH